MTADLTVAGLRGDVYSLEFTLDGGLTVTTEDGRHFRIETCRVAIEVKAEPEGDTL